VILKRLFIFLGCFLSPPVLAIGSGGFLWCCECWVGAFPLSLPRSPFFFGAILSLFLWGIFPANAGGDVGIFWPRKPGVDFERSFLGFGRRLVRFDCNSPSSCLLFLQAFSHGIRCQYFSVAWDAFIVDVGFSFQVWFFS